jgi:hypothetical protein
MEPSILSSKKLRKATPNITKIINNKKAETVSKKLYGTVLLIKILNIPSGYHTEVIYYRFMFVMCNFVNKSQYLCPSILIK